MLSNPLNTLVKKVVGFLPDRGEKSALENTQTILEFGRLVVEKSPNGKIRLKIGDGTKKYLDQNYIGESIVERADTTTVKIGDSLIGTNNKDKSFVEWLNEAAYAYQSVVLNSINIDQNDVELGQSLNNSISINLTITNSTNLANGSSAVVSSSPSIFTPQSFDPRSGYIITGVSGSFNVQTDIVLTVVITGKNSETSVNTRTIKVSPKIWWGSSALTSLTTFTQLKALGNNKITRERTGDYSFVNNYSYIGFPSTINISGLAFIDLEKNSNTELLTYAIDYIGDLVVTNDYGVQVTYKVYRSTYLFGGITKFRVK